MFLAVFVWNLVSGNQYVFNLYRLTEELERRHMVVTHVPPPLINTDINARPSTSTTTQPPLTTETSEEVSGDETSPWWESQLYSFSHAICFGLRVNWIRICIIIAKCVFFITVSQTLIPGCSWQRKAFTKNTLWTIHCWRTLPHTWRKTSTMRISNKRYNKNIVFT